MSTKKISQILGESGNLSDSAKQLIEEAWGVKLQEARDEIASELREEFARKYKHDKAVLAETVDKFLSEKIAVELEEFAADKKQLTEERVAYKQKLKQHSSLLESFVTSQLANEVKELRADKLKLSENFKRLENFLLVQLSEEIREFRQDKRELAEQRVKLVAEGKKQLHEAKTQFINRAAKIVNSTIENTLKTEIGQFKNDIMETRKTDFGRRVFEAFVSEFSTSYLSEGSEIKKLQAQLIAKDKEINLIAESVKEKEQLAEGLKVKLAATQDRIVRQKELSRLLKPLAGDRRSTMLGLLESVQTKDLERTFNKYLQSVLNEKVSTVAMKKHQLNESVVTEQTGGRKPQAVYQDSADDELAQIKFLAGLNK
jgi:prophage DNA circulation protein